MFRGCERRAQDSSFLPLDGPVRARFRPDGFALETNQFQELLAAEFWRMGREQKMDLPIYGINNQTNKLVRLLKRSCRCAKYVPSRRIPGRRGRRS
jgi:hypothetical protein